MKADVPSEFLKEYEARRERLYEAMEQVTSLLTLRIGQLRARKGVRGRITDSRVKRPGKLWRNAKKKKLLVSDAFTNIEDLIGIRIVCNNLSDIEPLVAMIREDCSILRVLEIKSTVSAPSQAGYRATHVRAEAMDLRAPGHAAIPCEIQIRTLAQDTWARMSRADLYDRDPPGSIGKLAAALSTQLSAIDEIGQLIRDELNQCPLVAEKIADSDFVSPQRLALLYRDTYDEDLFEWSAIDWVRQLDDAEVEYIGEVRTLLAASDTRRALDKVSVRIRGFPLENSEWAVYSALIAGEVSTKSGVREVRKRIAASWNEVTSFARRETLSELPGTIEDFARDLQSCAVSVDALRELGGLQPCSRCGADIICPEQAAEAVLEHYGNPELDMSLEALFEVMPQAESVDVAGVCSYCGHQMLKDD